MTSQTFVLLSGALSFGVPIALAIRELLAISAVAPGGDEPPPENPTVPTPKPLPACLLPRRTPARIEVLEVA